MRQDDSCLFCCDCREQLVTAAAEPGKPGDKAKKGFVSSPRIYYLYSIISKAGRMKDSSRFNKKLEGGNVWMNMARKFMGLLLMVTLILTAGLVWAEQPKPILVNITEVNPRILIDLRYATTNNFLKQKVYPNGFQCLLLEPLAQKLNQAQLLLEKDGLGLKIFDGYRPLEVQKKMWKIVPDERYVANPYGSGSNHNRGAAVDLTLVDKDGNELEMPTGFDDFTERASKYSMEPTPQQRANRMLLRQVMEQVGLEGLSTEWWHFQLPNAEKYPIQ